MISDFQYERLCWLIENKDLSETELQTISDLLRHPWPSEGEENANIQWMVEWLRGKPSKKLPPPWDHL